MSLTIVASFLQQHCRSATSFLENAGLKPPESSGDTALDPVALTSKMRTALLKKPSDRWTFVDYAQIGKAWQIKAADLIVANADQVSWGWGDPDILPFLDFWAKFEPNSTFALFYSDPGTVLRMQYSYEEGKDIGAAAESVLQNWQRYNDNMLRFYNLFPDRCILANISAILKRRSDLNVNVVDKLHLQNVHNSFEPDLDLREGDAVLMRAMKLVDVDAGPVKLFDELEATADCQGDRGANDPPDLIGLFARSEDANRRLFVSEQLASELGKALEAARQEIDVLAAERGEISVALESARKLASEAAAKATEWESAYGVVAGERDGALAKAAEIEKLEMQASNLSSKLKKSEAKLAVMEDQATSFERARMDGAKELTALSKSLEIERTRVAQSILQQKRLEVENELLSLQLDLATAELQRQHTELIGLNKKVEQPFDQTFDASLVGVGDTQSFDAQQQNLDLAGLESWVAVKAPTHAATDGSPSAHATFSLDLRLPIDGTDWYEPEDDGRWAGPATRSSLVLPSVGPGKYRIAVTMVDGISRSAVLGTRLAIGGTDLPVRLRCRADLEGLSGKLKQLKARFDAAVSPFPVIVLAELEIRDAPARPLRLFLEFPEAMTPADTCSQDNRILTARVSQVRLERMP
jgi:hypothetical protein